MPALLDRLRLGHGGVRVEGTPRRLAVVVHQLAGRQSNAAERVRGPPAKVGWEHGLGCMGMQAAARFWEGSTCCSGAGFFNARQLCPYGRAQRSTPPSLALFCPQVAYDAAGSPTPALLGFCKKNGVTVEDCFAEVKH